MLLSCCRYGEHLFVFSEPSSITRQHDHNLLFLSYCLLSLKRSLSLSVHDYTNYICLINQKRLLKLVDTEILLFSTATRPPLGLIQSSI
jgi:hypothetical protein